MDPNKWEDVSNKGVMVSNLPLLFAGGYPTCLLSMKYAELEKFVPFMVRCSLGENQKTSWSQLDKPVWWPKKLPFRMPNQNNSSSKYGAKIIQVKLVERCYAFHGCDYLLQFCTSLVKQQPACGYRYNDNRDGTTSMYHGNTGKLLVTFRNENREYDKNTSNTPKTNNQYKKLLPSSGSGGSGKQVAVKGGGAMVQPPIMEFYLCEKCDASFDTLKEALAHEKNCTGQIPLAPPSPPSPEPDVVDMPCDTNAEVPFMSYFGLEPSKHTGLSPYMSPRKNRDSSPPRMNFGHHYLKYDTIPLTSPFGRLVLSNSRFGFKSQSSQHQILKYEKYILGDPDMDYDSIRESRTNNRWILIRSMKRSDSIWCHQYSFNKKQLRERLLTINTGLISESRLLLKQCKPVRVKLKRVAKRTIDRLTRRSNKKKVMYIDLTSPEDSPMKVAPKVPKQTRNVQNSPAGSIKESPVLHSIFSNTLEALQLNNTITWNNFCFSSSNDVAMKTLPSTSINDGNCGITNGNTSDRSFATWSPIVQWKSNNIEQESSSKYKSPNRGRLKDKGSNIEVIDLSSDEEEPSHLVDNQAYNHLGGQRTNLGYHSKNVHSHWSSNQQRSPARNDRTINGQLRCTSTSSEARKIVCYPGTPQKNLDNFKDESDMDTIIHVDDEVSFRSPKKSPLDAIFINRSCNPIIYFSPQKLNKSLDSVKNSPTKESPRKNPKPSRELSNLLKDECRELRKKGLEKLRSPGSPKKIRNKNLESPKVSKVSEDYTSYMNTDCQDSSIHKRILCYTDGENPDISHQFLKLNPQFNEHSYIPLFEEEGNNNNNNNSLNLINMHLLDIISNTSINSSSHSQSPLKEKEIEVPHQETQNITSPVKVKTEKSPDKKAFLSKYLQWTPPKKLSSFKKDTKDLPTKKMSRELQRLAGDECKELRIKGFHPTNVMGTFDMTEGYDSEPSTPERTPPPEPPVESIMKIHIESNSELKRLLGDECKELKKIGYKPNNLKKGNINIRCLRSSKEIKPLPKKITKKWVSRKNTRQQETHITTIETERSSQRSLLLSEMGMCVLLYHMPTIF